MTSGLHLLKAGTTACTTRLAAAVSSYNIPSGSNMPDGFSLQTPQKTSPHGRLWQSCALWNPAPRTGADNARSICYTLAELSEGTDWLGAGAGHEGGETGCKRGDFSRS